MVDVISEKFPIRILVCILLINGIAMALLTNTPGLFYATVSKSLGVARSTFSLYYTVLSLACMVTLFFSGQIMAKYHKKLKLIVLICAVLQFGGYYLFYSAHSLTPFFLGGILVGIGNAFDTFVLVALLTNNWFKKKNGLILGIAAASCSAVAAIVSPRLAVLIASDWRMAYLVVGSVAAAVIAVCGLLVSYSPQEEGKIAWGSSEVAAATGINSASLTGVPYAIAVKSASFWLLIIMTFCATSWAAFSFAVPGYVSSLGYPARDIGLTVSCFLYGALGGKLFLGWLNDRLGAVRSLGVIVVLGLIGMLTIIIIGASSKPILFTGAVLFGVTMAITGVHPPFAVKACFGDKDYTKIYSNISIMIWVASSIIIPVYNLFFDKFGTYIPAMWLAMALIVGCFVSMVFAMRISVKLERV